MSEEEGRGRPRGASTAEEAETKGGADLAGREERRNEEWFRDFVVYTR